MKRNLTSVINLTISFTALFSVCASHPVVLRAQEHFRNIPIEFIQVASSMHFGEVRLNVDSPDWQLPKLVLDLHDESQVRRVLSKRARDKLERLKHLYDLSDGQTTKLFAAAKIDIHDFFTMLGRVGTEEIIEFGRLRVEFGRLRVVGLKRVSIQSEFFDRDSMFDKVLTTTIKPPQNAHREHVLRRAKTEWLRVASRKAVLDWLAVKADLSRGQRARLLALLRSTTVELAPTDTEDPDEIAAGEGQRIVNQLCSGNAEKLRAILREDQLTTLKAYTTSLLNGVN